MDFLARREANLLEGLLIRPHLFDQFYDTIYGLFGSPRGEFTGRFANSTQNWVVDDVDDVTQTYFGVNLFDKFNAH